MHWANAEKHKVQNPLSDLKIKKAIAIAQSEDAVVIWEPCDQTEITDGVLYRKSHVDESYGKQNQLVVPQGLRETVLEQLYDLKPFCLSKELGQGRTEVLVDKYNSDNTERKYENCTLGQARSTAGKKRIARLQIINVGIRFSKVAADIQGLVTRAKTSIPKYIPALKDYFTKYVVCLSLERTTANVSRAIAENWILTFGAPDSLHANQRAKFCSELLLEVC